MKRSILDAIGSPLVQVSSPPGVTVAAKVESFNPGGSAKDRPAREMVLDAERAGKLSPGDRLVEPTSGNTGIGLAMVGAARGYDVTIVMPSSMSEERRGIMRAYGADIEFVDGDMTTARERADEIATETSAVQLQQFENEANPRAHYRTTAEEILEQVDGRAIDAFVAGVGTGGTISGNASRLLEEFPDMRVVAVEPEANAVLSTGVSGSDDFQGMGPGFVSENLDRELLDEVRTVALADAEAECRRLAREEGVLVGQSSGASSLIAREVAGEIADPTADCPPAPGRVDRDGSDAEDPVETDGGGYEDCPLVVTIFWDSGERYMSAGTFD